jgi:uncharacterized protein (TIGR04255 family)
MLMAGKYRKAPLVYMSAILRTTPFPELEEGELKSLSRLMLRIGFPIPEESWIDEVDLTPSSVGLNKVKRRAYLSVDRRKCIVIDRHSIELRFTDYNKYLDFSQLMDKILNGLSDFSDVGLLHIREITLSYADVIVPFGERKLEDYFAKGDRTLPLGVLSDVGSLGETIGNIQLTRVVGGTKKILFSIEQLPVISNQVTKFLPLILAEPAVNFNMPINIRPEWKDVTSDFYCLLTTQASMLSSKQLKDIVFSSETNELHGLVSKTFEEIINKQVCNIDWEYSET